MNGNNAVIRKSSITLEEMPLTIDVERKRIRNIYLYVKPGAHVVIRAPYRFTDEEIRAFAHSKTGWLVRQLSNMRTKPAGKPLRYESGETLYLWGAPHPLIFLPDPDRSFVVRDGGILLSMPGASTAAERARYVKGCLKQRLNRAIRLRLPVWEKQMGLSSRSFSVRDMKSRWGSCNIATAHLTFNLELVKLDPICLDYIIVHELAHLRHGRHNRAFWNLVGRHLPDWKQIRGMLDNGKEEASAPSGADCS